MAPFNNRFFKADTLVLLASLFVGAVLWFSVSRDRGYFSSTLPTTGDGLRDAAMSRLTAMKKDGLEPHIDGTALDNAAKADRIFEVAADEERAGLYKEAIDHYKEACKFDPLRKRYWSALGSVYISQSMYEEAEPAFMQVYNLDAYDIGNMNSLGFVFLSLRKDEEAKRFYLMLLTIRPDQGSAWEELAHLANGVGLQPFQGQIQQMARTPLEINNSDLVYQINQAAIEDHPDDYYYLVNRALINLRWMRLSSVQPDIDRALKVKPDGAAALLAQAQLYHYMGELDKAVATYKRCIAVSPQTHGLRGDGGDRKGKRGKHRSGLYLLSASATELGADKPSWVDTLNKLRAEKTRLEQEALVKASKIPGNKAVGRSQRWCRQRV